MHEQAFTVRRVIQYISTEFAVQRILDAIPMVPEPERSKMRTSMSTTSPWQAPSEMLKETTRRSRDQQRLRTFR